MVRHQITGINYTSTADTGNIGFGSIASILRRQL